MPARDTQSLTQELRRALGGRPEVLEAYLFGSLARGRSWEGSDVDVAVFVTPQAKEGLFGYVELLTADLMAALGTNRVDVVLLNRAPPLLYHRVLRDGIRLLARDSLQTTVREGQALSRYCDYVPQLAKIDAALAARIKSGAFGR